MVGAFLALPSCVGLLGKGNSKAPVNWKLPTMGGKQFWTDVQHRSDWRIQRHFATGHHRLLDPGNSRQAWGARQHCEEALAARNSVIGANQDTVLILAHGLGRTSKCWGPMQAHVAAETDWQVIRFAYASTRKPIGEHASALAQLIEGLGPEVQTIHLAGHSLGNIVFRHYLADTSQDPDPRIGRMVMIGPPNQGSRMARVLHATLLFPLIVGKSGVALGRGWKDLEERLATPSFEFGIIAGGKSDNQQGWNLLLDGASDGLVGLSEAQLPGASDVMVRPLFHTTMMKNAEVCQSTVRFLRTGAFSMDGLRRPAPK